MDYLIRLASEASSAKYWWWLLFIVLAVTVVFLAKLVVNLLESIAERTKIASAFIGGVMLAIVTSLPEFVSAIYSGLEHKPEYGVSNAFGANMLTACLLGVIDLIFVRKLMFKKLDKGNKLLMLIMVIVNILMIVGMATQDNGWKKIPGVNMSWITIIPIVLFIFYALWSTLSRPNKEDDDQLKLVRSVDNKMEKIPFLYLPMWKVWIYFTLGSAALVFFAFNNATVVDKFSTSNSNDWGKKGVYAIPLTTGAGLFLSLATSLPEITSIVVLMRKGLANIAVGGIMGSHLFNVAMIGITDIIDQDRGTSFNEIHGTPEANSYLAWIVGAFIISIILLMNAVRWGTKKKWKFGFPLPISLFSTKERKNQKIKIYNKPRKIYIMESVFLIVAYLVTYFITTFAF